MKIGVVPHPRSVAALNLCVWSVVFRVWFGDDVAFVPKWHCLPGQAVTSQSGLWRLWKIPPYWEIRFMVELVCW